MAQMVKNLSAVQETGVRSLGWEDPLEEGMATHSSILAWRIPWTAWQAIVHGVVRVGHDLVTKTPPHPLWPSPVHSQPRSPYDLFEMQIRSWLPFA